jgi:hypothetical protein
MWPVLRPSEWAWDKEVAVSTDSPTHHANVAPSVNLDLYLLVRRRFVPSLLRTDDDLESARVG